MTGERYIALRVAPDIDPEPPEWMLSALCAQADPDCWFPEQGGDPRPARRICNGNPGRDIEPCPVKAECLAYALDHNEPYGVWGGLTERERRPLARNHRRPGPHRCRDCDRGYPTVSGLNGHRGLTGHDAA